MSERAGEGVGEGKREEEEEGVSERLGKGAGERRREGEGEWAGKWVTLDTEKNGLGGRASEPE